MRSEPFLADHTDNLLQLLAELGTGKSDLPRASSDQPQKESDDVIIAKGSRAANGNKFVSLYRGDWQQFYKSQSEADQALINMLGFYSKNSAQIARIFLQSGLGQREKALRVDYLATMIQNAFDRDPPSNPNVDAFADRFRAEFAANTGKSELKSNVFTFSDFTRDSGTVTYIMHHVFQRAFLYAITGTWGSGKTAFAIIVALHVALGLTLCGHRTVKSKVLILCGENPEDVKLRIRAACAVFGIDPAQLEGRIFFTQLPFAIDDPKALETFAADASRHSPFDLMIIDTGPAHSSVEDENDNMAMHGFAQSIRTLMDALGKPATLVLMHATKSATRETVGTPRGGGAFSGSVDGLCGVWRDNGGQMEFFHGTKLRGPGFNPMFFDLERYELADIRDNFGEAAISVVAVPAEAKTKTAAAIKGATRIALNALAGCKDVAISPPQEVLDGLQVCNGQLMCAPHAVVSEDDWRKRSYAAGISDKDADAKSKAFRRARSVLLENGSILTYADHYWIPEWAMPQPN